MTDDPKPELIAEWCRWQRGNRNAMLRNAVILCFTDEQFETVFGPLDSEDRAQIETWRKRLAPPPRTKEPPKPPIVVFTAPPGKGRGDFE